MEPHRRPSGRRVLLPFEAEICNTLGLTEEDYWYFVGLTEEYNGKQPEGYELIPEVRNDPVSIIVSLVIGVALSAIGALLAPKPQAPKQEKQRANLQTESITGRQRFTPTNNFDSLQELATLGETIPLVYTRRGTRVSTQLLWSQMLSFGTGQQLSAIMLVSHGPLGAAPDFAGYAIGDTLLENYFNARLKIYWRSNGGRLLKGNAYSQGTLNTGTRNDQFAVKYDGTGAFEPIFSGARNPSTQVQFGIFSPVPNGMKYKVEYELVLVQKNQKGSHDNDVIKDQKTKRRKIAAEWPHRAAITAGSSTDVTYTISSIAENAEQFQPWGTEDVRSATESSRIHADEAITVGEQYMIGSSLAVCLSGSNEPWEFGKTKTYKFKIIEGGQGFDVKRVTDLSMPYAARTIQRVAVATITNNRACHATEIGIKSTVYKRLNGTPNFNSQPPQKIINRYQDDRAFISLGHISGYFDRYSFFTLQARPIGGNSWKDISGGAIFAVKGRTPQAQYNYIRITHKFGQYEFKLRPYAGNVFFRYRLGYPVFLLKPGTTYTYTTAGYKVTFSGILTKLNDADVSNSEWIIRGPGSQLYGDVISLSSSQKGSTPYVLKKNETRYGPMPHTYVAYSEGASGKFYWKGDLLGEAVGMLIKGDKAYKKGNLRRTAWWTGTKYYEIVKHTIVGSAPPDKTGTLSPSGGSGSGLKVSVKTWNNGAAQWVITNGGEKYKNGDKVTLRLSSINSAVSDVQVALSISKRIVTNDQASVNPYDAIADYWLYDSEESSHADQPEHEIVYVNEQVAGVTPGYDGLAIAGMKINASTEWSSFSNFSAYVQQGIQVQRLISDNGANRSATSAAQSTNLFPEIAYDLLTSTTRGAGALVGTSQVNRSRMQVAAKFCRANGFYWDGAIIDNQNLRQFIYENAGFCLLDFTILGGQFSLYPSVPFDSGYKINKKGKPTIKALFTDGNIRDLQVSFLSPEERQAFRATVIYREEKKNGFPQTRVFSSRLNSTSAGAPEETFDLASFCTSRTQAEWFARVALQLRDKVDHSVQFETTPQAAMGLVPGEYIRLVSEATHTDRFENGSISNDGYVSSANVVPNNTSILYWKAGTTGVKSTRIQVSSNRTTQQELWGSVFAVVNSTTTSRTYKVESITYGEDGLIQVTGSFVPLTSSGTISYLDWDLTDFIESVG